MHVVERTSFVEGRKCFLLFDIIQFRLKVKDLTCKKEENKMSTVETLKPKMHHSLMVQKNSAFFSLRFNALNGTKALLAHMFRKSIGTLIFSIKPKI